MARCISSTSPAHFGKGPDFIGPGRCSFHAWAQCGHTTFHTPLRWTRGFWATEAELCFKQ